MGESATGPGGRGGASPADAGMARFIHPTAPTQDAYFIRSISLRVCRSNSRIYLRSAMTLRVKQPCLSAFLWPVAWPSAAP